MTTSYFNPFKKVDVYIVRHAETDMDNIFEGWLDPLLNADGIRTLDEITNFFSYERVGKVVTSDLQRCLQTAGAIMATGNVCTPVLELDFNLRPLNIGELAGQPKNTKNRNKLQYYHDHPETVIPGGESVIGFDGRAEKTLNYFAYRYEDLPTVLVTHSSNIAALYKLTQKTDEYHELVAPGGIIALYLNERDGSIQMAPCTRAVEV